MCWMESRITHALGMKWFIFFSFVQICHALLWMSSIIFISFSCHVYFFSFRFLSKFKINLFLCSSSARFSSFEYFVFVSMLPLHSERNKQNKNKREIRKLISITLHISEWLFQLRLRFRERRAQSNISNSKKWMCLANESVESITMANLITYPETGREWENGTLMMMTSTAWVNDAAWNFVRTHYLQPFK